MTLYGKQYMVIQITYGENQSKRTILHYGYCKERVFLDDKKTTSLCDARINIGQKHIFVFLDHDNLKIYLYLKIYLTYWTFWLIDLGNCYCLQEIHISNLPVIDEIYNP